MLKFVISINIKDKLTLKNHKKQTIIIHYLFCCSNSLKYKFFKCVFMRAKKIAYEFFLSLNLQTKNFTKKTKI